MAYDQARRQTVLFGGVSNTTAARSDTWEWDGKTWTERVTTPAPPGLVGHAMVYDNARRRSVLFGGGSTERSPVVSGTWAWAGMWSRLNPAASPPARVGHAMAYDVVRDRIVLFGGSANGRVDALLGDTWEFDGTTWRRQTPIVSPPARLGGEMTYDPALRRVVLTGGYEARGRPPQTWVYDGMTWAQVSTQNIIGEGALVYDTSRACALWFDGQQAQHFGSPAVVTAIGRGCSGSVLVPRLTASLPHLGNRRYKIDLLDAAPTAPCVFGLAGASRALSISPACTLYLSGQLTTAVTVSNASGFASRSVPLPFDPALRGITFFWQAFALDARAPVLGLSFSNAVQSAIGY